MRPHPADRPQTDGSTLAPVVKISGRQRPEPLTELGFARRLVDKHGDELRYVVPWNRWLVWDGRQVGARHRRARTAVHEVIARKVHTARSAPDADPGRDPGSQARRVQLRRQRRADAGPTEPEIAITPDLLDAHPYLLNCRNGVVDLQTGELLPHDPALLLTKMAGAAYEPDAEGAVFTKFLERIQPSEEMRLFIRRLLGLSLEGKVTAHILPIFYGDGANGKSRSPTG